MSKTAGTCNRFACVHTGPAEQGMPCESNYVHEVRVAWVFFTAKSRSDKVWLALKKYITHMSLLHLMSSQEAWSTWLKSTLEGRSDLIDSPVLSDHHQLPRRASLEPTNCAKRLDVSAHLQHAADESAYCRAFFAGGAASSPAQVLALNPPSRTTTAVMSSRKSRRILPGLSDLSPSTDRPFLSAILRITV